jgi:hypothetical protein
MLADHRKEVEAYIAQKGTQNPTHGASIELHPLDNAALSKGTQQQAGRPQGGVFSAESIAQPPPTRTNDNTNFFHVMLFQKLSEIRAGNKPYPTRETCSWTRRRGGAGHSEGR